MTKLSRYVLAGSIACAAVLASSGAFAGPVDDELARIDQLLAAAPSQSTGQHMSPTMAATNLRAAAAASLRAGDVETADAQAKLALHQLGEDGIPVNSDALAYTCIGGCPGSFLPSVAADDIAHGATAPVQSVPGGRELRPESTVSEDTGSAPATTTVAHTDN